MEPKSSYQTDSIDWFSRYLLSWQLSNSLDLTFCQTALEEALNHYPSPEIFNTDQGSQFTSQEFIKILGSSGKCVPNILTVE